MSERISYMKQGVCAECGSELVKLTKIEKEANILVWYECANCGCEFIEVYTFEIKGVTVGGIDG